MEITLTINKVEKTCNINPGITLQKFLFSLGYRSVRDSDDSEGFSGSDTVLIDGLPMYASLLLAVQVQGKHVTTPESLIQGRKLSVVQQSMIDAGIVQSGYNAPAAALLITELLERVKDPKDEDIIDGLSGLFNRATGYKQFFHAVELAKKRLHDPDYSTQFVPEFRKELRHVGKVKNKIDGAKLVTGAKAFVEDMVDQNSCVLKMLRSPHAHAYIKSIDTSEAEDLPGVVTIITYKNCPDIYYGQAGQGFPEPSPYDRRMFNRKMRHVGDRVAAVAAETEEIAKKAIEKIKVEYEVLQPVLSIDEAMSEGAPIVQNGKLMFESGAPENLSEYNKS
ncbi:MAG: molybdopterin-dependent oxidoreductase Mo/Fe-S-binding subunit, partial [Spirochaetales bacterium]|nr:molybdopterin-dependent oxidoreductase Mo/Fe-S-binding subunit [Spirochaetales bacterium]